MLDNIAEPLGRYLMSSIFLTSVYNKITDFKGTQSYMELHGMPFTAPLLVGAIAFEALGSVSLITNRYPKTGAAMLIVFLSLATAIFHNPLRDPKQSKPMMKNLALLGGLLHYYASFTSFGPAGI